MEDEVVSLIDDKAEEGQWFPFKGKAAFLVKWVSQSRRRWLRGHHVGKKSPGKGEGVAYDRLEDWQVAVASEALLDSRMVQIPGRYLEGSDLAADTGEVRLDGKWSDDVKRAVLSQLPGLAKFIVEKCDSLAVQADEEEQGKE